MFDVVVVQVYVRVQVFRLLSYMYILGTYQVLTLIPTFCGRRSVIVTDSSFNFCVIPLTIGGSHSSC